MGETSRSEHLQWCKDRAKKEYEYYKTAEPSRAVANAIASMVSDLGKHPDTQGAVRIAVALGTQVRDAAGLHQYIEGFN